MFYILRTHKANYDTLEEGDGSIYIRGINHIRVFGSGSSGFLPDGHGSNILYDRISINDGDQMNTYPQAVSGASPRISPDETLSGWVYGLIEQDETPELQLNFQDQSETWGATDD